MIKTVSTGDEFAAERVFPFDGFSTAASINLFQEGERILASAEVVKGTPEGARNLYAARNKEARRGIKMSVAGSVFGRARKEPSIFFRDKGLEDPRSLSLKLA